MKNGFPLTLDTLVSELSRLPSIGRRSATRIAFHILRAPRENATRLADALAALHSRIRFCKICGHITEEQTCDICRDPRRQRDTICVVEDIQDVVAMEKTIGYHGLYHVLGGHLAPLQGITSEDLNIASLITRVRESFTTDTPGREIILATNPTPDGEATAMFIAQQLAEFTNIEITRPGLGLSMGTNLEYTDEITLRKALESRKQY